MIIVYDNQGRIEQCVFECAASMTELAEKYRAIGKNADVFPDTTPRDAIRTSYIDDGEVVRRPETTISGLRELTADGEDTLTLTIDPQNFKAAIGHGGLQVGEGVWTNGVFELQVDEPGEYLVRIEPDFPYLPATFTVTAT